MEAHYPKLQLILPLGISDQYDSPSQEGLFYALLTSECACLPSRLSRTNAVVRLEAFFYNGERLRAEVSLFGSAFLVIFSHLLAAGCAQILCSHGVSTVLEPLNAFAAFQVRQPEPLTLWRRGSSFFQLPICQMLSCSGLVQTPPRFG